MKQTQICFVSGTSWSSFCFSSPAWGQINVGTIPSAVAERSAVCRGGFKGTCPGLKNIGISRERYRTATATDDRRKKGRLLSLCRFLQDRTERPELYASRRPEYGILDMEFQWDQIPHWFSDVARTHILGRTRSPQSFLQAYGNHGIAELRHLSNLPVVKHHRATDKSQPLWHCAVQGPLHASPGWTLPQAIGKIITLETERLALSSAAVLLVQYYRTRRTDRLPTYNIELGGECAQRMVRRLNTTDRFSTICVTSSGTTR